MLTMLTVFSVFNISCSDNDTEITAPGPATDPAPQPTPAPDPAPGPRPPSTEWFEIRVRAYTDAISPENCDMPFYFRVQRTGIYRAGPCTRDGDDFRRGDISATELTELNRRARAWLETDIGDKECRRGITIAQSDSLLLRSSGRRYQIVFNAVERYCHRGDEDAAANLHSYILNLREKYYPTRSSE